jgi:hypothetical protein
MITSYFEFFQKIFEANEIELAESFIVKLYKARMLASEKVKAKAKKLEEEPNISDADLRKYLNKDVKLTSEQEKEAKDIALTDPFYNRIEVLTEKKKEWFPLFLQFFFSHFKNSRPNAETDREIISDLLGEYDKLLTPTTINNITVDRLYFGNEDIGIIGTTFNKMLTLKPNVISKILGKLPDINKMQNMQKQDLDAMSDDAFIKLAKDIFPDYLNIENEDFLSKLSSEPTPSEIEDKLKDNIRIVKRLMERPGHEILGDFIEVTQRKSQIDFLVSRLPRGIKDNNPKNNRPDLFEQFNKLKMDDKLTPDSEYTKSDLINLLGNLVDLLNKKGIALEVTSGKNLKERYPYETVFVMRQGSREEKQEDVSLESFRARLTKSLNASSNSNIEFLDEMVKKVNKKYGENSAVVVWRDQTEPKVILSVNNHKANVFLHNKAVGELKQTQLCIAWESDVNWNKWIGDENKLYFIYNFLLGSENKLLPFGVAIKPNGKVGSAFDRMDENGKGEFNVSMTQTQVEEYMRNFGMPYEELKPIPIEEIQEREFKRDSRSLFITSNLTVENLKRILETGIDPNYSNGQAMINSLQENNFEKVKILIAAGARIDNLGVGKKSAIDYASSLETLILLIQNGVKIKKKNETYINNIITGDILKPNFAANISTLLELIPKYSVTKADISLIPAHDIYERMLDLAYKLNNLPLFKVVAEASKKRLLEDFEELDFLAEFINRGIVKAAKYKEILINTIKSVYADDPEYVEELIQKINK